METGKFHNLLSVRWRNRKAGDAIQSEFEGLRMGMGAGAKVWLVGSKELVFPKTFQGMPRSPLTSALPTAERRGLRVGMIPVCSALALACVLPRVSHRGPVPGREKMSTEVGWRVAGPG